MSLPQGLTQEQFKRQCEMLQRGGFDGDVYDPNLDLKRLVSQHINVFILMMDGIWRTLEDIELVYGYPQASISATLRDFRKDKYGGHTLNKQRIGNKKRGWFEYQLILKIDPPKEPQLKLF